MMTPRLVLLDSTFFFPYAYETMKPAGSPPTLMSKIYRFLRFGLTWRRLKHE
ncbi:hypothetical protein LINPERHAP1_LOCUS22463 [Linum perenne]